GNGAVTSSVVTLTLNHAPALAAITTQILDEQTTFSYTNSTSDADGGTLTYALTTAPTGMTINATNGVISWTTSEATGPSTNTVTVRVTDDGSPALTDTQTFTVLVSEVNLAPALTVPANQTLNELTTLNVSASATDADVPTNTLTFSLVTAPTGMTINASSGAMAWTPAEAQGPSTNTVTVRVTDNGSPNLSDTKSFTVTVNETNTTPLLTVPANQTLDELTPLSISASATDSDLPANTLTFALLTAPSGLTIDASSGAIAWTPSEAQGPSTNTITVRVTDNGSPNLSGTNSFIVIVNEVNTAPTIVSNADVYLNELTPLTLTNVIIDTDVPANPLTFTLATAPSGMSINATNGVLTWTPSEAQGPSINPVTVIVSDNGSPAYTATNSFTVLVSEVNSAPTLAAIADQTLAVDASLSVTAVAHDSDLPANSLTFSIIGAPAGMHLNPTSGLLTWTPALFQRPSSNLVTVSVTDNAHVPLSTSQSFIVRTVVDDDTNAPTVYLSAPVVNFRTNAATLRVTGTATDNRALARVRVSVNGGGYTDAVGTASWAATVALAPGTNTVAVFAEDASGNISSIVTRSFFRIVTTRLTVNYYGRGTASPNLNGSLLELNRTYTLTAQPQADWLLTNWSGDVSGTNAALTFTMTSNLVINANFVSNPIVRLVGSYNGLFAEAAGATVASAGFASVKLDKSGAFSAALLVGGRNLAFTGKIGCDGHGLVTVARIEQSPLTLELQFDATTGGETLAGTVSTPEWSAPLVADRAVTHTNFVGKYTLLLPGSTNLDTPSGTGYGLVTVAGNAVSLLGALGDGAALKQNIAISRRGEWPLCVPLYAGTTVTTNPLFPVTNKVCRGLLIGWAHFTNGVAPAVSGSFVWLKNPCTNGNNFPDGFEVDAEITGARYTPPTLGMRAVNLTNGTVTLTDGDLAAPLTANFSLSTANVISFPAPNVYKCLATITPGSGLVKLTFTPPGTPRAITATGVILQGERFVDGYFLGAGTSGRFTMQSP
ncbi:MAG: hypothetical protein RL380_1380, partial [Verrucomicrobiota bacterium]